MIRRVADTVQISYDCEYLAGEFVYSTKIIYGSRALRTSQRKIPLDDPPVRALLQSWADRLTALDELRKKRHLAELGSYIPGEENFMVLIRRTKELDDQHFAALGERELNVQRAREALERQLESIPVESPLIMMCDGRYYALHEGTLWTSTRRLTVEQWLGLISQTINREDAKLASLALHAGLNGDPRNNRPAIPSPARIEVWRRDGGRCARCGSRERLEYDHIIPIARGGSNTARNIELLCETCNRAKSASIT